MNTISWGNAYQSGAAVDFIPETQTVRVRFWFDGGYGNAYEMPVAEFLSKLGLEPEGRAGAPTDGGDAER